MTLSLFTVSIIPIYKYFPLSNGLVTSLTGVRSSDPSYRGLGGMGGPYAFYKIQFLGAGVVRGLISGVPP